MAHAKHNRETTFRGTRSATLAAMLLIAVPGAQAVAAEWGGWRDYLAQELTPGYARTELSVSTSGSGGDWTSHAGRAILPDFAAELLEDNKGLSTRLTLSRERRSSSLLEVKTGGQQRTNSSLLPEGSLRREYVSPGVEQQLTDSTFFNVALVLASQQYGAANLGYVTTNSLDTNRISNESFYTPYQETVYGTGVRFGIETDVLPWLAVTADYQSRIDMEGFSSFRGVYADPADLDVPARFSTGLNFTVVDNFELVAETERVIYSNTNAFPSNLLPQRFLSLLGDSTSPEFAWSDLTVYRFGWNWQLNNDLAINFAYATRSQPLPTSNVLADALREDLARNSFSLGVNSYLGEFGELTFNAAYAPAEYAFGGNVLGIVTSDLDKSLELEMQWRLFY